MNDAEQAWESVHPEDAWYAFQEAAYERDSRQRFESALATAPDLLDGVRGVTEWAFRAGQEAQRLRVADLEAAIEKARELTIRLFAASDEARAQLDAMTTQAHYETTAYGRIIKTRERLVGPWVEVEATNE